MGQHADAGAECPRADVIPVAPVRSRRRDFPDGDGLQLPGRWPAGCTRSATRDGSQIVTAPLLEVDDLRTYFHTDDGVVRAVDGVSFAVSAGETLAIVGESGSGKSVTALSILRLIPEPPGKIEGGRVLLEGRDLLTIPANEMRRIRGSRISMIFQE